MVKKKPAPPTPNDTGDFVLHGADEMLRWYAGQMAKAVEEGVEPAAELISTQRFIKSCRDRLALLLAMLEDPSVSEEDRKVIDEAIGIVFMIGETKGALTQTLHGRANRKRAQAELMRAGRDRARDIRLASERAIIKETGWSLDGDGLARRLAERLGPQEDTGKLVPPSTMIRDIERLRAESRGT